MIESHEVLRVLWFFVPARLILPTLACPPIVLAGSVAGTALAWALGLKEAWI
jgi:hypothetical protein